MGLDMYLYACRRKITYNYYGETKLRISEYPQELKECALQPEDFKKIERTSYLVGYWRKANAIHNYFVEKIAKGIDECQEIPVSLKDLQELMECCEKVLNDISLAKELLPPRSGFFFGDVEIDDWYYQSLKLTIRTIKPLINLLEHDKKHEWQIVYQASW